MSEEPDCPKPGCNCDVELNELPVCNDSLSAILCAVAHEQAEMARILKILRCKLCKSAAWMPDSPSDSEVIDNFNKMGQNVAQIIKALAAKENSIANKLDVVKSYKNIMSNDFKNSLSSNREEIDKKETNNEEIERPEEESLVISGNDTSVLFGDNDCRVTLKSISVDNKKTTFCYQMEVISGENIKYWFLGINLDFLTNLKVKKDDKEIDFEIGFDPKFETVGIKFKEEQRVGTSVDYYFTVEEEFEMKPITVGIVTSEERKRGKSSIYGPCLN